MALRRPDNGLGRYLQNDQGRRSKNNIPNNIFIKPDDAPEVGPLPVPLLLQFEKAWLPSGSSRQGWWAKQAGWRENGEQVPQIMCDLRQGKCAPTLS